MQDSSAAGNAPADPADDRADSGAGPGTASEAASGAAPGDAFEADSADAARRLGAALERIARLAPRARDGAGSEGEPQAGPDPALAEVAARLDRLIAQLRGVIAGFGAGGTQS